MVKQRKRKELFVQMGAMNVQLTMLRRHVLATVYAVLVVCSCCLQMTRTAAWQPQPPLPPPPYVGRKTSSSLTTTTTTTCLCSSSSSFFSISDDPGGDPVQRLPLMEAELASLGPQHDDQDKAVLQSAIGHAKTAAELGVRAAQLQFYEAFSAGDLPAMDRLWSTVSHVRVVHPGMASIEGRAAVMSSWKQVLAAPSSSSSGGGGGGAKKLDIQPTLTQVEIHGLVAICSCVEKTSGGLGGNLQAINIYKREDGAWKMTLHQAGPIMVT